MPRSALSAAEARRTALAAQGFGRPRTDGRTGSGTTSTRAAVPARSLSAGVGRLGLLQIDSVNVFERSHYLPLFARLGAYDRTALDRLTHRRRSPMIEYWAHEAAFIPRATLPLFRWKMDAFRARDHDDRRRAATERVAPLQRELLAVLRANGPLPASAVEHESNVRRGPWWGWSDVKLGLEYLFRWGDVVSAGRRGFERVYALPSQVLDDGALDAPPGRGDAVRSLVEHAARALGVGTRADIADYFRLRADDTGAALRQLEDAGTVLPVQVEGWRDPAWMHADARVPRRLAADAVLSPFDPVVWFRPRAERMFGFRYRIEIYTPAPARRYGYYVLPVLQDDALVGRVDLKSDRGRGVLRVRTAWQEPGIRLDAGRLAATVRRAAEWQGLGDVEVTERGTAARVLADALGVRPVPHIGVDDTEGAADTQPTPSADATA